MLWLVAGCSALGALLAVLSPRTLGVPVVEERREATRLETTVVEERREATRLETTDHADLVVSRRDRSGAPDPRALLNHRSGLGFRILAASPVALATTLLGVGSMFAIGPLQAVVLPAYFAREAAPELLGAALATVAVGLIGGALLSAPFAGRAGRRAVLVTALVASLAGLVAFAALPSAAVAIMAAVLVGLGFGLLAPILPVLVTEHVPESGRARVFGLQNAGYLAAYPLGALLVGFVVQGSDVRVGAIVCAALWAVLVVFGLLAPALSSREPLGRSPLDRIR